MPETTSLPNPITLGIKESCRLTGLGRSSIYKLIRSGRLTPIRIYRRVLIRFDDLEQLVSSDEARAA